MTKEARAERGRIEATAQSALQPGRAARKCLLQKCERGPDHGGAAISPPWGYGRSFPSPDRRMQRGMYRARLYALCGAEWARLPDPPQFSLLFLLQERGPAPRKKALPKRAAAHVSESPNVKLPIRVDEKCVRPVLGTKFQELSQCSVGLRDLHLGRDALRLI